MAEKKTPKTCFVVSEFGKDPTTILERKQTLKHLVRKVLEPMGYDVQRADDIDDLGQITHQIIEHLLDDDLVVADLTGLNPNVFYELAVRHAARKPVITLMTHGRELPFDTKDVRTVFYDLHDPDKLEEAQEELEQKVQAMEDNAGEVRNPITVVRDVTLLQQSDNPDIQAAGAVLEAIGDLRDEVRRLGAAQGTLRQSALKEVLVVVGRDGPVSVRELAEGLGVAPGSISGVVKRLEQQGLIESIDLARDVGATGRPLRKWVLREASRD